MKTETITFRLTEQEKEALKKIAAKRDVAVSKVIRDAVAALIEEDSDDNRI